jgi:hypothetical protein
MWAQKIRITGNSHGRDCASKVKYDLNNTSEVKGVERPEAGLITITKTANEDIKNLTKKDGVVVWGGTTYVGNNKQQMACWTLLEEIDKHYYNVVSCTDFYLPTNLCKQGGGSF